MVIAGGRTAFDVVTLTGVEVAVWPSVSVATTVRLWVPLVKVVVFHEPVKVGPEPVTGAPRLLPSTWN